jgi:putative membrane protein
MTALRLFSPDLPGWGFFFEARHCVPRSKKLHKHPAGDNRPMLWIKAFHVIFVASWFAGLFYLPRLYVNLAAVPSDSHAERERLLLMARKLYRFSSLLMVVAIGLGIWLCVAYFRGAHGWLHAKLLLVVLAVGYHHACLMLLRKFEHGTNRRSHRWFRVFNELAVLLFACIVVLVVVKPF